jgi:hypothetical protein
MNTPIHQPLKAPCVIQQRTWLQHLRCRRLPYTASSAQVQSISLPSSNRFLAFSVHRPAPAIPQPKRSVQPRLGPHPPKRRGCLLRSARAGNPAPCRAPSVFQARQRPRMVPKHWLSPVWLGGVSDHPQHRCAQSLSVRKVRVHFKRIEQFGHKLDCAVAVNRPMRYDQRLRSRIEERARQTGKCLRTGFISCCCIACRKHHKVGIKFQCSNLTCSQQTIVVFRWFIRD